MKVLLIEDNEALANITKRMLHQLYNHDVEHAATGAAAVELASNAQFDLILIDLNLPDMNGYEVATQLRKMNHLENTILVALTGMGEQLDQDQIRSSGFDACYTKPMDFNILETLQRRD